MIHVFRDPVGNIYEQNIRGFGERIGVDPREFQLTFLHDGEPVPIMALGVEDDYLAGNAIERLVILVERMFRLNLQGYLDLDDIQKKRVYFLEFEDFLSNPFPKMKSIEWFIGEKFSSASKRILRRERCPRILNISERHTRINSILDSIGEKYKSIFVKLLTDYDAKPWELWV